jgi:hypothetical protein
MTPKEKIADLLQEKAELFKVKNRLRSYEDYANKGKFDNATTNKHVLETIGSDGIGMRLNYEIIDVDYQINQVDRKINRIKSKYGNNT